MKIPVALRSIHKVLKSEYDYERTVGRVVELLKLYERTPHKDKVVAKRLSTLQCLYNLANDRKEVRFKDNLLALERDDTETFDLIKPFKKSWVYQELRLTVPSNCTGLSLLSCLPTRRGERSSSETSVWLPEKPKFIKDGDYMSHDTPLTIKDTVHIDDCGSLTVNVFYRDGGYGDFISVPAISNLSQFKLAISDKFDISPEDQWLYVLDIQGLKEGENVNDLKFEQYALLQLGIVTRKGVDKKEYQVTVSSREVSLQSTKTTILDKSVSFDSSKPSTGSGKPGGSYSLRPRGETGQSFGGGKGKSGGGAVDALDGCTRDQECVKNQYLQRCSASGIKKSREDAIVYSDALKPTPDDANVKRKKFSVKKSSKYATAMSDILIPKLGRTAGEEDHVKRKKGKFTDHVKRKKGKHSSKEKDSSTLKKSKFLH